LVRIQPSLRKEKANFLVSFFHFRLLHHFSVLVSFSQIKGSPVKPFSSLNFINNFIFMQQWDVIVIGGGAAGLMCGLRLAEAGRAVLLLEAREKLGGRIHTIHPPGFSTYIEAGAEFIHGEMPLTLSLLQEAKIPYYPVESEMLRINNGKKQSSPFSSKEWEQFIYQLKELKQDMSLDDFLLKYFSEDKFTALCNMAKNYASGYDAADTSLVSSFALREEWLHEDDSAQYRIEDGYGCMIQYLEKKLIDSGGRIRLSSAVKNISWEKNSVTVTTQKGETYSGTKLVITVPLGILQLPASHHSAISFLPSIDDYMKKFKSIGFGNTIKVILQVNYPFIQKILKQLGSDDIHPKFILTDEIIPAWWTQSSPKSGILTGWVGGNKASELAKKNDNDILEIAVKCLSGMLSVTYKNILNEVNKSFISNWYKNIYTFGSYSYPVLNGEDSIKSVNKPLVDTVYFCGEGLYLGAAIGTVEAALFSGHNVAHNILINS
jgi:monoamine oxidase